MIDATLQRKNMVESQVRPSDVTDRRIIRAMNDVPREEFVPAPLRSIAYADTEIRIKSAGPGAIARGLMAPRTFAKLLQLSGVNDQDVVLDIGCGTGYSAAVLARLAETVVALEQDTEMAEGAIEITNKLALDNLVVVTGDLAAGYPSEGPFDAIIVEGAVSHIPTTLLDQLKDGGRLVAIITDGAVPQAAVWHRFGEKFDRKSAFEASAPQLPDFEKPTEFIF